MEYKKQADRTSELNSLVKEGTSLYAKLFNFTTDTSEGLIKVATGGIDEEPTADNQVTFASIIKEGPAWADKYQFLIDESDTTYMKGRGYIQIDISQTPQSMVSFFYQRRGANQKYPNAGEWGEQERPAQTTIYAANTLEDGGDWTQVGTLDMSELADPIIASINMGKEYKYLRYQVEANKTGGGFSPWAVSRSIRPTSTRLPRSTLPPRASRIRLTLWLPSWMPSAPLMRLRSCRRMQTFAQTCN
jgi:hypothetical protein